MRILARPLAVLAVATLLTTGVLTGTASSAPSIIPPLVKAKNGTAILCLDPAARSSLAASGIDMSTGAPAQLLTNTPQPCANTYVPESTVNLGVTDGNFPFHGSITFTRATDQAKITFTEIKVSFGLLSNATAVVDGDTAHPITLLTFIVPPANVVTDGRYLIAHDVPLNLTADGAAAFAKAFGASPVAAGKALFIGTGYGQLEAGLLP